MPNEVNRPLPPEFGRENECLRQADSHRATRGPTETQECPAGSESAGHRLLVRGEKSRSAFPIWLFEGEVQEGEAAKLLVEDG